MAPGKIIVSVRRTAESAAWAAFTVGVVVLAVGWWGGVDSVAQVIPATAPMKANTALGFILGGGALLARQHGRSRLAIGLAGALTALGGATVLEYATGLDFGIDQLLATDRILDATASPGRPGLNTAVAFTAIGAAVLLGRAPDWRHTIAQLLAVLTGSLALMALQGYIFDAQQARGIGSATQMAPHTSIAMILLSVSFVAGHTDRGVFQLLVSPRAGGRTARQLLPLTAGGVITVAAFVVVLTRTEVITDANLQLAVLSTLVIVLVSAAIVLVARRLDVTDAERRAAEEDLSGIVLAFPDLHVRVSPEGVVQAVHGSLPAKAGLPPRVGDRLLDVLPGVAELVADQQGADSSAESPPMSVRFDRSGMTLNARIAHTDSDDVVVSIRDITALVEAQEALERLNAELEERVEQRTLDLQRSNEELERFAYVASHDLQEPLRMVSAFVSRLSDKYGDVLDEKGRQYVRFAVDGAQRMSALIEALLEYSRAGSADLELSPVNLHDVVDDVEVSLQGALERSGGRLHRRDLPTVLGDEVLVRQILQNLVGNALKFASADRAPAVLVTATTVGGMATVAVADNGIGIPDEFKDGVFAVFRRLHARADYPGTGIGLSIVQRLVHRLGGEIWVEDAPDGVGTIFRFTIPTAEEAL